MSVGHGAPGFLSNLRTYRDLLDDSAGDRRPLLEYSPGDLLSRAGWVVHSGACYKQPYAKVIDGMIRDVVGVEAMSGVINTVALTRVDSAAECVSSPSTYFYDIAAAVNPTRVYDEGTPWDAGYLWDEATIPDLYVHLPDNSSPALASVVALIGFYYSTKGEVHPHFGAVELTSGGFELWSAYDTPTGWTVDKVAGDGGAFQESSIVYRGTYSARLHGTGAFAIPVGTAGVRVRAEATCVAGMMWRFAGRYQYPEDKLLCPDGMEFRIRVRNGSAGSQYLQSNGRVQAATPTEGFHVPGTRGEWRSFLFDFIVPSGWTSVEAAGIVFNNGSSDVEGTIYVDDFQLRPIYRWNYYEPRLSADSLPETEVASQSILFGGKTVGLGQFSLANADGLPERAFAGLLTGNKKARVVMGGTFSDGQEMYRDDYRTRWMGITEKLTASDHVISMEAYDARALLAESIPIRAHGTYESPNMDSTKASLPRRISLGQSFAEPIRVDRDPTTSYGVYELTDPIYGTAKDTDAVFVAPTQEWAQKEFDLYALTAGVHYQAESGGSRFRILQDVRNMRYTRNGEQVGDNAKFDFDIGGATLTTTINMAGPANTFAAALQAAMNATAGVADITVTYSNTTHKWTVAKGAGTLNLRGDTGPNADFDYWQYLGFTHADKVSALSYTGEAATFTSADQDHIVRARPYGYLDDASGSITGTPSSLLLKHAHCLYFLLNKILGVPTDRLDKPSFDKAATLETGSTAVGSTEHVTLYLEESMPTSEVLSRFETALMADLVVDGDGVFHLRPYELVSTIAREFFDRDFLSFEMTRGTGELYRRMRILHSYSPNRKQWEIADSSDYPDAVLLHGRSQPLERKTWIAAWTNDANNRAARVSNALARLSFANPRLVTFTARGKLADVMVGDKIRITRSRAFDPSGALNAAVFRVKALRANDLTGVGQCVAIEDVSFLS